jgi:hypothetical protein
MVRRAAWTALTVRQAVPAARPLDDRFYRWSLTKQAFSQVVTPSHRRRSAVDRDTSAIDQHLSTTIDSSSRQNM